jgi:hypothetical protein
MRSGAVNDRKEESCLAPGVDQSNARSRWALKVFLGELCVSYDFALTAATILAASTSPIRL